MRQKARCNEIKDLEERLICLKDKYDHLTNELENTRSQANSDAGMLDYQQLIEERRIVEKYMQRILNRLDVVEKSHSKENGQNEIGLGCIVALINDNSKLKFRLVEELHSQDENQISKDSPIGKAVIGKRVGEEIEVKTPNGKIHYKITSVE